MATAGLHGWCGCSARSLLRLSSARAFSVGLDNRATGRDALRGRIGTSEASMASLEMAFQIARVFRAPLDDVFGYPNTEN